MLLKTPFKQIKFKRVIKEAVEEAIIEEIVEEEVAAAEEDLTITLMQVNNHKMEDLIYKLLLSMLL